VSRARLGRVYAQDQLILFHSSFVSGPAKGRTAMNLQYLCVGLAILATTAATAQTRQIILKNDESITLRSFQAAQRCRSIVVGDPALDVLETPEEVTVALSKHAKRIRGCWFGSVPGWNVVAKATGVKEKKDGKLVFRIKFKTKTGARQLANTYNISLYP
jgi:hypothetical protein